MSEIYQKIVRSGTWYYADETPTPVHIVQQNFDVAYELFKAEEAEVIGPHGNLRCVFQPNWQHSDSISLVS